jgi:beta-N-acetylhexosaminidase
VPTIMTAHILLPLVDPDRPASISPVVLQEILRRQMRFDGVILADDLGMGAIAKRYGPGESVVKTLEAGSDIAMLCHDSTVVPEAINAVAQSLRDGRFESAHWSASSTRFARLRERLRVASQHLPPLDVVGCAEHRALAQEIRARLAHAPE